MQKLFLQNSIEQECRNKFLELKCLMKPLINYSNSKAHQQTLYVLLFFLSTLIISNSPVHSQTRLIEIHSHKTKSFRNTNILEGNLLHLNLCGERPDHIQEIYKAAFNTLHADSNATFADVAKDLNFIKLCSENSITHSGGPMLGNISSHGADVWIRTLQPAKVEVQINVDGRTLTFGPVYSSDNSDMIAIVKVSG